MTVDVSSALDGLTATYTRKRQPKRPLQDGIPVDVSVLATPIEAVVTPLGSDITFDPGGDYSWDGREIYTTAELVVNDETREGDAVTIGGVDFFVLHVEDFSTSGGFYRALAYALRR